MPRGLPFPPTNRDGFKGQQNRRSRPFPATVLKTFVFGTSFCRTPVCAASTVDIGTLSARKSGDVRRRYGRTWCPDNCCARNAGEGAAHAAGLAKTGPWRGSSVICATLSSSAICWDLRLHGRSHGSSRQQPPAGSMSGLNMRREPGSLARTAMRRCRSMTTRQSRRGDTSTLCPSHFFCTRVRRR